MLQTILQIYVPHAGSKLNVLTDVAPLSLTYPVVSFLFRYGFRREHMPNLLSRWSCYEASVKRSRPPHSHSHRGLLPQPDASPNLVYMT